MNQLVLLHDYVEEMRQGLREGEFARVLAFGNHILCFFPKHLETYRILGQVHLEMDELDAAGDLFHRVRSVDPENFIALIGLASYYEHQGQGERAIWHLERARELQPANSGLRRELVRLLAAREGAPRERLKLSPGALARLYARQGLYLQAIQEFRVLLQSEPDRLDLQVALTEALYREGRKGEAAQVAQAILQKLPFCLKANLLLASIWAETSSPESEPLLKRAWEVDPEGLMARELQIDAAVRGPEPTLPVLAPEAIPAARTTSVVTTPTREEAVPSLPVAGVEPAAQEQAESDAARAEEEAPAAQALTTAEEQEAEHLLAAESSASEEEAVPWLKSVYHSEAETDAPSHEPTAQAEGEPAIPWLENLGEAAAAGEADLASTRAEAEAALPTPADVERMDRREAAAAPEAAVAPEIQPAPADTVSDQMPVVERERTEPTVPAEAVSQADQAAEPPTAELAAGSIVAAESGPEPEQPETELLPAAEIAGLDAAERATGPEISAPTAPASASTFEVEMISSPLPDLEAGQPASFAELEPILDLTQEQEASPEMTGALEPEQILSAAPAAEATAPPVRGETEPARAEAFITEGAIASVLSEPAELPAVAAEIHAEPVAGPRGEAAVEPIEQTPEQGQAGPSPAVAVHPTLPNVRPTIPGALDKLPAWIRSFVEGNKPAPRETEPTTRAEPPSGTADATRMNRIEPDQSAKPGLEAELPPWMAELDEPAAPATSAAVGDVPAWVRESEAPGTESASEEPKADESRGGNGPEGERDGNQPDAEPRQAPDPEMLLAKARELRAARNSAASLDYYEKALQRGPRYVPIVISELEEMVKDPDAPLPAHRLLGDSYAMAGRLKEALVQYRRVLNK